MGNAHQRLFPWRSFYSLPMAVRLENVVRMAVQTFAQRPNGSFVNSNLQDNIKRLRQLVDEIDPAKDLGFTREMGQPRSSPKPLSSLLFPQPAVAPVGYMEIFENSAVSIGVFIIKEGTYFIFTIDNHGITFILFLQVPVYHSMTMLACMAF